jgi:hypothetical protein
MKKFTIQLNHPYIQQKTPTRRIFDVDLFENSVGAKKAFVGMNFPFTHYCSCRLTGNSFRSDGLDQKYSKIVKITYFWDKKQMEKNLIRQTNGLRK